MRIEDAATDRFSVWPYVLTCGLSLFVFIVMQLYDGRIFADHDLYYASSYFRNANTPTSTTRNPIDLGHDAIQFWRESQPAGRLPTTLLYLAGRLWPMNLRLYRFFNLPFWLLAMIAAYFLGRQLADRRAGWLCAALAATLPVFSASTRMFLPHYHTMVFLLWTLVFLAKILRDPKEMWTYPLLGIGAGAAILSHPIGLLQSAPVFALLLIFLLWKKRYSSLLGWLTALAIAAAMNVSTWRVLSAYVDNKHTNFGTPSVFNLLFRAEAANAVHAANWLHVVLSDSLLLPRLEILLATIGAAAVGWWLLRSRKISFDWLGLTTLTVLFFLLGMSQAFLTRDAGTHFDLIGAFSLAGFLPVIGLYVLAGQHRRAESLRSALIAVVLVVGAWQQADMLKEITADPAPARENRTRVSLPADWMQQTAVRLRDMGARGYTPLRFQGFSVSSDSADFVEMDAVGIAHDLISAGKLYSLHLVPPLEMQKIIDPSVIHRQTNWGEETGFSVKLYFFRRKEMAKRSATIIRRECPALSEGGCSWFCTTEPAQTFDLPTANVLALISTQSFPDASTQLQ
ncbi:MAG TPA: glycosyltransferase family 39 protein [bacterium]|nr:glycosyltransferase family 39 protein [bacterium]